MKKLCLTCKSELNKDEIALNKKLINRNMKDFYCIKCLSKHLEIPEELLRQKIIDYKNQGCGLFS